jgi:hypothetical protein
MRAARLDRDRRWEAIVSPVKVLWVETLARATARGEELTEGRRVRLGSMQGGGGLPRGRSAFEACRKKVSRLVVVVLILDGLRVPLMMATATGCHR